MTSTARRENIARINACIATLNAIKAAIGADDDRGISDLVFDAWNNQEMRAISPLREHCKRLKLN